MELNQRKNYKEDASKRCPVEQCDLYRPHKGSRPGYSSSTDNSNNCDNLLTLGYPAWGVFDNRPHSSHPCVATKMASASINQ